MNCLDETAIPMDTILYPSSFLRRFQGLLIFSTNRLKLLISIFIFQSFISQ